jgi:DinB family protein
VKESIARFELLLATAPHRLVDIADADAARKPDAARWSKKEILGHLIDSAGNNQQRIVRAQLTPRLEFPNYEQEFWVARQAYSSEPWPDLVNLWLLLNRHLLHAVKKMPAEVWAHELVIGGNPPITLEAQVAGYLQHMDHHLAQIFA